MGPLVLGLGGLALYVLFGRKGGAAATAPLAGGSAATPQSLAAVAQMLFRDYQWTVQVPSLVDVSGTLSPPPGATIGSGRWWKYPGGIATGPFGPLRGGLLAPAGAQRGASPGTTSARPSAPFTARRVVQVPAWGGVPQSSCIYAWRPNTGTSQALNGYLLYGTGEWYVDLASAPGSLDSDVMTTGKGSTASGFNLFFQHEPPPPSPVAGTPAATVVSNAGKGARWTIKHPGLLVWLGASNANEADLQQLSAPVVISAPPAGAAAVSQGLPLASPQGTKTLSHPSTLPASARGSAAQP